MFKVYRKEITGSKVIVHYAEYASYDELFNNITFDNIYYEWVDLEVRHDYCYDWAWGDYANRTRDLYREAKAYRFLVTNDKGVIISRPQMLGEYRNRERARWEKWDRKYRWFRGSKVNRRRGQSSTLLRAEMKAHSSLKNNEEAKEYGCKPRSKRDWGWVEYPCDCRRHNDKSWKTQSKRKRQYKG